MPGVSVFYPLPVCILILLVVKKWKKPTYPHPPGPKGYPIIGNVMDLPTGAPIWESLTSLADRYGTDILYLRLMGEDMVVLSSNQSISDLIEKRSSIYADKAQSTMMKLTGVSEWSFGMMSYGDEWRVRRKLFHEVLNVRLVKNFDDHQCKYTYRLLSRLLKAPGSFMKEVEFMPGAVILSVTYGIDVKSMDDRLLRAILEAGRALVVALVPGKFLVDVIPILRHIPDWVPGTGFKGIAKEARDKYEISTHGAMEYVKNAMKSGEELSQSITSECLGRLEGNEKANFNEKIIRDVSSSLFAAAAETIKSTLQTFFLAVVLHPEVMQKAQEELDRVVGENRLPDFSDRDNLPYINALTREIFRWNPPLPICLPNRVTQDDVYRGYFIPAGATVVQNVWAIFRDPNLYPEPETFDPNRFLKNGKIDPLVFNPEDRVFGTGRRACPGKHFALRTIYLVISCVLSVFNVEPTLDDDGNPQFPEAEFKSFVTRNPKPFKCTIKPRSENAVKLVEEACERMKCY